MVVDLNLNLRLPVGYDQDGGGCYDDDDGGNHNAPYD